MTNVGTNIPSFVFRSTTVAAQRFRDNVKMCIIFTLPGNRTNQPNLAQFGLFTDSSNVHEQRCFIKKVL